MRQAPLKLLRTIDAFSEPATAAQLSAANGTALVTTHKRLSHFRKLGIVRFSMSNRTHHYALSERGKAILRKHAGEQR